MWISHTPIDPFRSRRRTGQPISVSDDNWVLKISNKVSRCYPFTGGASPEITGKSTAFGITEASASRSAGASASVINEASSPGFAGAGFTRTSWLGITRRASLGINGASSPGINAGSSLGIARASLPGFVGPPSPGVDGPAPCALPGVAPAARELRLTRAHTRAEPNTEIDRQLKGVHTLTMTDGQPRAIPAQGLRIQHRTTESHLRHLRSSCTPASQFQASSSSWTESPSAPGPRRRH